MPRKKQSARKPLSTPTRKSRRTTKSEVNNVPDVYQDMLAEAAALENRDDLIHEPANKRRRITPVVDNPSDIDDHASIAPGTPEPLEVLKPRRLAAQEEDSPSDFEDDFEDVNLDPEADASGADENGHDASLHLDFSEPREPRKVVERRKPLTRAEQLLRLDVHKWHILCLLAHLRMRNNWCDLDEIHAILKPMVLRKTISLLHLDDSRPQFQRSQAFMKAIEEICSIWRGVWQVDVQGMRRAFWKQNLDAGNTQDQLEDPLDFDDFKAAAKSRSGSRDLGAQLFCALLRSVGVETRLVCSLQPLPFSAATKGVSAVEPTSQLVYAPSQQFSSSKPEPEQESNPRWRSSAYAEAPTSTASEPRIRKRIRDSPYPVFWVEVYSPAVMKWVPLDPLVRNTVNKPRTGFEPPASDALNSMAYVIAFEEDGSAKDVTRRYVQFPNSKTRKYRVESTKGGIAWWKSTMQFFEKTFALDRDVVEEAELAKREASEPMPKSIQDFKGHPMYILERHLRRNEVIHPKREVGKIGVTGAKAKDQMLESVYRRQDVHLVKSAAQWYRRGRDVREGESGLKRAQNKGKEDLMDAEDHSETEETGMALYAEFQTDVYVPPPVTKGRVPKNDFGNLDIYVATMIPPGGIHVQHPEAARAARMLGLSYADAVTGFDFQGRRGTAVINGIVAASDFRDALLEVIEALEHERVHQAEAVRSAYLLQMWKRFLRALRIRNQVNEEYGGKDESMDQEMVEHDQTGDFKEEENGGGYGGGFVPDDGRTPNTGAGSPLSDAALESEPDAHLNPPATLTYRPIIVVESPHNTLSERVSESGLLELAHGTPLSSAVVNVQNTEAITPENVVPYIDAPEASTKSPLTVTIPALDPGAGGFLPDDSPADEKPEEVHLLSPHDGNGDTHSPHLPTSSKHDDLKPMNLEPNDETSSLISHDPEDEDIDEDMDWMLGD